MQSSNFSVRKSLPSQVNKSNAKKHGGLPRWNSRFLNCGLPRLSSEQISPSMTALTFGSESEIDSASAGNEAKGCPLRESNCARPYSITASARKPSYFQFVNPVGIVERSGPLQERHWLKNLHVGCVNRIPKWDELLFKAGQTELHNSVNDSTTCFGKYHGSEMSWLMSLSEWGESTV